MDQVPYVWGAFFNISFYVFWNNIRLTHGIRNMRLASLKNLVIHTLQHIYLVHVFLETYVYNASYVECMFNFTLVLHMLLSIRKRTLMIQVSNGYTNFFFHFLLVSYICYRIHQAEHAQRSHVVLMKSVCNCRTRQSARKLVSIYQEPYYEKQRV